MAHPGVHAADRPDATALIMAETGESMTWAELRRLSVQVANTLHNLGLRRGDAVAFCLENRFEFAALVWACQDAGYRYTPISTRLTLGEISYIIGDCEARVFLHSDRTLNGRDAAADLLDASQIIDVDAATALGQNDHGDPVYERAEGVAMLYSSGTTGKPKGVLRPAPEAPIETLAPGDAGLARAFGIDTDSIYLSTAPLYHSAPLTFLLQMGRVGAAMVIMDRFDAAGSLGCIERYRVTHSQWVPTMFVRLLRLAEADRDRYDLSSHRFAIHGAGPCTIATKEAMLEWWGPIIHEYYAGTEGAGTCLIGPEEWLAHKGSVGRSVRGPVQIIDDHGQPLPAGEIGQIWFGNSSDFKYHNDEGKTAEARDATGRATFGDIGYLDEEGYLYLTDRKSFTIISGGVNIYPREIEDVLLAHPGVDDVIVFGVENEEYGEEVKAVVQQRSGVAAGDSLVQELKEHCRQHLANYKIPRTIELIDQLPREPTGKLRLGAVRDLLQQRGTRADEAT